MADAFGLLGSASDYGGYGAADGYGYESSIDCNSALGLIGLLGLIELLRDIIDDITSQRRRRSAEDDSMFSYLLSSFGSAVGGPPRLLQAMPAVVLPLVQNLVDVNDGFESAPCLERAMCEANRALLQEASQGNRVDEAVGGVVASLLSQVLSKSFSDYNPERYKQALRAAEAGRKGTAECARLFPECPELRELHSPMRERNFTRVLHSRTNGVS
ncbi:uncharacterized protein LOC122252112 [Penaeus japonicus]|uniref:uncharacterized protein LOC122252112 n=1 Tax=Penaeus japonicus TaxID=27405 RepID=UPI001C71269D|nr:uncharacterized protein LOC122252112 [Penaeus japonicus]